MSFNDLKQTICDVAHQLWNEGLIDFPDGNLSVIVQHPKIEGEKVFLATISGCDKRYLETKHVRLYGRDGKEIGEKGTIFEDGIKPTKDLPIHIAIYGTTKASAVLHSHGHYAQLYAAKFAGKILDHPLGLPLTGKNYWSVDLARLGMVAVTEAAYSGENTGIAAEVEKGVKEYSRAIIIPTSGSYIYSVLEDPITALWNCFYAARNLERWAKYFVKSGGINGKFDGTGILKVIYQMYGNAPPGELPLFEQMKARGM